MAEASAAAVYTGNQGSRGDNSGSAPVLDQAADFLPYAIQFQQKRDAARAAEATRLREAKKDQDKAWAALEMDMPDVWSVDAAQIEQDLTKYHDSLVDEKLKGGNPLDPYSESGKMRKQNETQIKKRTSLAKDTETKYNKAFNDFASDASGKYDKKFGAEWLKKNVDPNLTVEERAKMWIEGSPYKLNYSETAFIDDTLPDPTQNGRKKFIDKEAHLAKMAAMIASPEGQDIFNTLKKDGEDEVKFMERMADEGQKMHPPDYGPTPQSSSGDGSTKGKLEEVTTIGGDGNGITTFVSPNETLPTLTFVDENGNGYASEKYIAKRNANGNVYAVEVEVAAKKPTPPDTSDIDEKLDKLNALTPKNKSEEANIESQKQTLRVQRERMNTAYENELDSYKAGNKTTKVFPISSSAGEGTPARANYKMFSKKLGKDLDEGVEAVDSSSYEIKGKTYTEAELLGMGYKKEQIAKYKK
jgi:hypothetical protein